MEPVNPNPDLFVLVKGPGGRVLWNYKPGKAPTTTPRSENGANANLRTPDISTPAPQPAQVEED